MRFGILNFICIHHAEDRKRLFSWVWTLSVFSRAFPQAPLLHVLCVANRELEQVRLFQNGLLSMATLGNATVLSATQVSSSANP